MMDEEVRARDDARDAAIRADRKANEQSLAADEARVALEQAERVKKQVESERTDNLVHTYSRFTVFS